MQATLLSLHLADPKGQVTQVPRSHLAQQGCLLCDHPGSPRAWGELMPGSASGNNNEEDDGAGRNTRDLERPQSPGVSGKGSRSTGVLSSVLPIAGKGEGRQSQQVSSWLQAWLHQWNFGVLDEELVHTPSGLCARYTEHTRNVPVLTWALPWPWHRVEKHLAG